MVGSLDGLQEFMWWEVFSDYRQEFLWWEILSRGGETFWITGVSVGKLFGLREFLGSLLGNFLDYGSSWEVFLDYRIPFPFGKERSFLPFPLAQPRMAKFAIANDLWMGALPPIFRELTFLETVALCPIRHGSPLEVP